MGDDEDFQTEDCSGADCIEERSVLAGEPSAPTASHPIYYSIKQVAEMFGRSTRTVRHWIQKGYVKAFWIGNSRYISASELDRLQDEGRY